MLNLINAIDNSDIDTFLEYFVTDNISDKTIPHIIHNPYMYTIFESVLESNSELCTMISKIKTWSTIIISILDTDNTEFFDIILKYIPNNRIMRKFTYWAMVYDKMNICNMQFSHGCDIKSYFNYIANKNSKYMRKNKSHNCITNLNPIIHLEKLGINILDHINRFCCIYCHAKNLEGINFCLKNGAYTDINILHNPRNLNIDIIKCAIPYGINLNLINLNQLRSLIIENDVNLNTLIYFMDHGLKLNEYFKDLSVICIIMNCPKTLEYFIELGLDIHFDNELLLVLSCRRSDTKCVKLLLSYGAHTDLILSFGGNRLLEYNKYYKTIHMTDHTNWLQIIMILIEHGAMINDPTYLFYIYHGEFNYWNDDYIFVILLEHGVDFNTTYNGKYILELVAIRSNVLLKLCLKYGADPYINNHGPLKYAICYANIESVKILLDLNSTVDPNLDCNNTSQEIIDLLDQYQITHNLKFYPFLRYAT